MKNYVEDIQLVSVNRGSMHNDKHPGIPLHMNLFWHSNKSMCPKQSHSHQPQLHHVFHVNRKYVSMLPINNNKVCA